MTWRCPACTLLRLQLTAAGDENPRPGRVYRCSVCRLELALNEGTQHMEIAPFDAESDEPRSSGSRDAADKR